MKRKKEKARKALSLKGLRCGNFVTFKYDDFAKVQEINSEIDSRGNIALRSIALRSSDQQFVPRWRLPKDIEEHGRCIVRPKMSDGSVNPKWALLAMRYLNVKD